MSNNVYSLNKQIDKKMGKETTKFSAGDGGGNNSLETRVARLEVKVDHIQSDISEIKLDLRDFKSSVDARFNKVDERFNKVDERFNKADEKFNTLENTLNRLVADMVWVKYGIFTVAGAAIIAVLKLFWHSIT